MRHTCGILAVAAMLATIGCEGNITPASQTADAGGAPPPPAPAPPVTQSELVAKARAGMGQAASAPAAAVKPAADAAAAAPPAAPAAPAADGTAEKAQVGVGTKGRDYGGPGFVTTPVQEYFRAGERIAFEVQIPNAMKLYKAEHDNKGPKTHEEFMNIIIKENAVALPELPAGEEYFYDPATEALMVRKPAQ
jgi:hypothetical protein